ncbi:Protein O-GlcNAcase [Eumeta japonica]|uniref:protein O-GlcNAcase n=1 Tax=Eumeta variegata TaxID=151549 RepID=A0A4C1V107_EUMVA|nr:Protein O-GlcNAcase [Eumeta japonica]
MTESSPDEPTSKRKDFICGVVEGFYGRPWTTEQRKDLFQKLKKWGMDMYVYAPKDDYKHRAYWRELYTVEEAEHLTSLISAARAQGITFCYALSPGLDITYSSQKEITALKRKLEQVSQFGCTCFALLFDDIEPEMSEADKQIFQSFAHAQVSVTNEIHQHLGCPRFLLCPTQYCSTRAVPTVNSSEYLDTLGSKLANEIDIMWTGPKVISKTLTTECIEEITQVLRRPPVIWDNLHANDYDQKRLFLGPYCGRSPELIPLLRGVLTNPNCEYNANMIPIWTLAHWASCSLDARPGLESVSWDIKLERESEQGICEDEAPLTLGKHIYHHRQALRQAINEWLPEFSIPKIAQGPVIKPQPSIPVPPVPIIPILPSVNTCMSLVTPSSNTTTVSAADMSSAIPTVNTSQLQALADVCSTTTDRPVLSTGISPIETFTSVQNPVMNSLVSPTKVILNESIPNPIIPIASSNISIPSEIPVSTLPVPILGLKTIEQECEPRLEIDHAMTEKNNENTNQNESLVNVSIIETPSFIEDMKREDKSDVTEDIEPIVVDDLEPTKEPMQNGNMSIGDTPQTMSPSRAAVPEMTGLEPLDVDPPLVPAITTEPPDSESLAQDSDIIMGDGCSENGSMQVEPSNSPVGSDMMIEPVEPSETVDEVTEDSSNDVSVVTADDLVLLCDLFYLPFEHGSRGLRMLHDFHWLVTHAATVLQRANTEVCEWRRRRCRFAWWCARARRLLRRLAAASNRELHAELHPYVWELCAVLALLDGFVRWLGQLAIFKTEVIMLTKQFTCRLCATAVSLLLGRIGRWSGRDIDASQVERLGRSCFARSALSLARSVETKRDNESCFFSLESFQPISPHIAKGVTHVRFSKGWREAFESGHQEPWVFRGGLTADLRRLVPVECTTEVVRTATAPLAPPLHVRPYCAADENAVCAICHKTCRDGSDCSELFPSDLQTLPADRLVVPFLTLTPEFCMLIEDDNDSIDIQKEDGDDNTENGDQDKMENRMNGIKPEIVGYACAALNSKEFYKKQEIAWIPEMCKKYPEELIERADLTQAAKDCIRQFHSFGSYSRAPDSVTAGHPALLTCCVLPACRDPYAPARLVTCLLAALRANGANGIHVCINRTDHFLHQFYSKLGFTEITHDPINGRVYLGRTF